MTSLILALVSASLIISLFSLYKLRETRNTLAIMRANLHAITEEKDEVSEALEILKKQLDLCEQEVSATHDVFHGLDLNYEWLKEKVQRLNIEALECLNIDDVDALQKVIELQELDVWLEEHTAHLVSTDDLNDALDEALSNLVIMRRDEQ